MTFKSLIPLLLSSILASACGVLDGSSTPTSTAKYCAPSTGFQESDLIGKWERRQKASNYETLIFLTDKTFQQIYYESVDGYRFEGQGQWWIETRPQGGIYVHAEGMRYYYLDRSIAEAGNKFSDGRPYPFWDPCEERIVEMPNSVILAVVGDPDSPKGIQLIHMAPERDASWQVFQFTGGHTSNSVPTINLPSTSPPLSRREE